MYSILFEMNKHVIKFNGQVDMNERFSFKQHGILTIEPKLFPVKVKTGYSSCFCAEAKSLHGQRIPSYLWISGVV